MKSYLAYATAILLMTGCASVQKPAPLVKQESPLPPVVQTVQILENPGAEFPTMCMLLQSDGSLLFKGGMLFYNPSVWRYGDKDHDTLILTLGGTEPLSEEVLKDQLASKIGGLTSYDLKRRELVYHFDAKAEFLNFGNFYFYRSATCHAT